MSNGDANAGKLSPPPAISEKASGCASPSSYLGLANAGSPRAETKTVSIDNQPEFISPFILGNQKNVDDLDSEQLRTPRKAPLANKRLSGRLSRPSSPIIRANSIGLGPSDAEDRDNASIGQHASQRHVDHLIEKVTGWIRDERIKRGRRKQKRNSMGVALHADAQTRDETTQHGSRRRHRDSDASDTSFDLDRLDDILRAANLISDRPLSRKSSLILRPKLSLRKLRKPSMASSDTDHFEPDTFVPSCDVILDNSKTLSYVGGASDSELSGDDDELSRTASYLDQDAWSKFKYEIVRLVHTLRLKGWRRVPLDYSNRITVQRLSGALTNCVYVVSPPDDLPTRSRSNEGNGNNSPAVPKKPPPKLLLRVYGAQVEHLIDRESELAVLRRLARKRIGPRLLGTFGNGRFEEYLYAKALTAEEMRNPDTSRQIAKRMRELHDGVDLLDEEREAGPFVWRNWDKWLQRVERIVCWLDAEVQKLPPDARPSGREVWKRRGLICGAPWAQFRATYENYRRWLVEQYGSTRRLSEQLVFAHNDTQYGNILRLVPSAEDSPLLLPTNSHKQLVVIDFEYANANTPGLEFANHFSEWCYNYHDEKKPYAFHAKWYPTLEEQDRFVRAYVRHRPQFNVSTPNMTPAATPPAVSTSPASTEFSFRRPTSNIGDFMLDARAPTGTNKAGQSSDSVNTSAEKASKAAEDREVARLIRQTQIWRIANTAQWVAWGLVQAEVPGMPDFSDEAENEKIAAKGNELDGADGDAEDDAPAGMKRVRDFIKSMGPNHSKTPAPEVEVTYTEPEKTEEEAKDEFDYLGYAQHRALFFWGDAIEMGFVKPEDLPEEVLGKLKSVSH